MPIHSSLCRWLWIMYDRQYKPVDCEDIPCYTKSCHSDYGCESDHVVCDDYDDCTEDYCD